LIFQSNTAAIVDIEFINESTGFVLYGMSTILKTTNGGLNWESRNFGTTFTSIYFYNDSIGYLSPTGYRIWKTTNTGFNWSELPYLIYNIL